MKRFRIRSTQWPTLSAASRQVIEGYFSLRKSPNREQRWLDSNNRYRVSCTSTYEADVKRAARNNRPLSRQKHRHVSAYVGASAPAHLVDGWSFLGRAVDAALRGDTYSSAHLAYYAELRAAMSLLGAEGIGIFNQVHAVVGKGGTKRFPNNNKGTHAVVWPILRFWCSLNRASTLIDQIVRPEQIPLSVWLRATSPTLALKAIGQRWFSSWGLDLQNVHDDHDTRNLASYRPSEFRPTQQLDPKVVVDFVYDLWTLFEPGQGGRFPTLERLLLRNAWRKGATAGLNAAAVEQLGIGSADATKWVSFLTATGDPSPILLAEQSTQIEEPNCHLRIMSRAALLLFVASGAARLHLRSSGYSKSTVAFWWHNHGLARGLWSSATVSNDPLDTWSDIKDALDDVASWSAQTAPGAASMSEMRKAAVLHLSELGAFERAGIWCLVP